MVTIRPAVDSIEIPSEYLELASHWYAGSASMLYAIASTGGLCLGSIRPLSDGDGEPLSDETWYVSLWDALDSELCSLLRQLDRSPHFDTDAIDDIDSLRAFQEYAQDTASELREAYGIEN